MNALCMVKFLHPINKCCWQRVLELLMFLTYKLEKRQNKGLVHEIQHCLERLNDPKEERSFIYLAGCKQQTHSLHTHLQQAPLAGFHVLDWELPSQFEAWHGTHPSTGRSLHSFFDAVVQVFALHRELIKIIFIHSNLKK